ncbi:unnamed protein product [Brassica oleracea var. botrytis]
MEHQRNKWTKPPTGFVKCNYDGAYNNTQTEARAGWIIRDDLGIFKGAAHASNQQPKTALERELQALLLAMMNCWSKRYRHVIFEGDNINAMKPAIGETNNIDVTNWIRDIWKWAAKFEEIKFCWTNGNSNLCADILAKQVIPSFHHSISTVMFPNL